MRAAGLLVLAGLVALGCKDKPDPGKGSGPSAAPSAPPSAAPSAPPSASPSASPVKVPAVVGTRSATGFADPNELAKEVVKSADAGDVSHLFVSHADLAAAVSCASPGDDWATALDAEVAHAAKDMAKKPPGASVTYASSSIDGDPETHAKGSTASGCTFNQDVVKQNFRVKFDMVKDGEKKQRDKGIDFVKIGGGGWFLLKM